MSPSSLRTAWIATALTVFAIEILIATAWNDVPFVRADLGDFLVAILLYALAKSVRPFRATPLAGAIFLFACAVEAAQAFSVADRLGFPRGSIPSIVIGTTYQTSDLLMYLAGSLTAWIVDRPGRASSRPLPHPPG
jgi:hypothetical protein